MCTDKNVHKEYNKIAKELTRMSKSGQPWPNLRNGLVIPLKYAQENKNGQKEKR